MSVIVGEPQQVLREFADAEPRVVTTRAVVAREMAVDYLTQGLSTDLCNKALASLDPRAGGRPEWEHKSSTERALWLEQVQSKPLTLDAAFALQWLQIEAEAAPDPIAKVALLTQWRPAFELPTLAVLGSSNALAQSVVLADAAPRLPIVFVVEAKSLAATLNAQTPRVRALLHDAVVHPPAALPRPGVGGDLAQTRANPLDTPPGAYPGRPGPGDDDEEPAASQAIQEALHDPALQQLRDEATESQQIARETSDGANAADATDRARSAVERFLYQLLQRSPHTRDVFALNARLPFKFGAHDLEADFAACSLQLVMEVDGYFHFTSPDAYRRDRRKDLLLQQRGYLVARFLADDVLERTSAVMAQIEQLVIWRRGQKED